MDKIQELRKDSDIKFKDIIDDINALEEEEQRFFKSIRQKVNNKKKVIYYLS